MLSTITMSMTDGSSPMLPQQIYTIRVFTSMRLADVHESMYIS